MMMRTVAVVTTVVTALAASARAGAPEPAAAVDPSLELATAAFGGYFTVDAATGETVGSSGPLRGAHNVYSNLSPPGTNNVVFGLAELDTVYGDQITTIGRGMLSELALTVYNSDAGSGNPILTMNLHVSLRRNVDNSLLGEFDGMVDFGAGLPGGVYAIVTFANLDMLPSPIIIDRNAIRVEQQRISHTGGADRMGVASVVPVQVGSSPDTMLLNGAVFGLFLPLQIGYRVQVIPAPCSGDADGDNDVDIADLGFVLSQFGMVGSGLEGDVDGDLDVDITDLGIVLAAFGNSC